MTAPELPQQVVDALRAANLTWDEFGERARDAAVNSHSPYSKFPVGAAVLGKDGTVSVGVNVEAASYGLTNCAERSALFSHVSCGHATPVAVAVVCPEGDPQDPRTVSPCGACRQVMMDLGGDNLVVWILDVGVYTALDLLPIGFRLEP